MPILILFFTIAITYKWHSIFLNQTKHLASIFRDIRVIHSAMQVIHFNNQLRLRLKDETIPAF